MESKIESLVDVEGQPGEKVRTCHVLPSTMATVLTSSR